jgi:hypothetical protein
MSVQFGILARLTWWEYSWDIMEPGEPEFFTIYNLQFYLVVNTMSWSQFFWSQQADLGPMLWFFKDFCRKKLAKKLAFFAQTTASFCKYCDHNIGFWEKRQFFRRKLGKIAENCDHNIDPRLTRLGEFSPIGWLFTLGRFLIYKYAKYIFGMFMFGLHFSTVKSHVFIN